MTRLRPYTFPNGRSKHRSIRSFDPAALRRGMRVEAEHSSDPRVQARITMDHLTEDPAYYDKLKAANLGYTGDDCALTPRGFRAAGGAAVGGAIGFGLAFLFSDAVTQTTPDKLDRLKVKGALYVALSVLGAIAVSASWTEIPECPPLED